MSFKKYINCKKEIKTQVSIENYRDKLKEELFSLMNQTDFLKIEELKNNLINEFELSRLLNEINYPHIEKLKIILKTNNPQKISEERKRISNWAEDSAIAKKVVSLLLFYESIFYSNSVSSREMDKIVESYCDQVSLKIFELASKIDEAKEEIKWHNHPIMIEAIYPDQGFLAIEAYLKLGNMFKKQFIVNLNSNQIKKIDDEQEVPVSLKEDSDLLINKLTEDVKKNKIAILYMNTNKKERNKLEEIKKEIVLGIKQFLPLNSTLSEEFSNDGEYDTWKIRTDLNKLKKINNHYIVLAEDVPIKWISRIK